MRWLVVLGSIFVAMDLKAGEFRVLPYVQNPTPGGITIRWLSDSESPGTVEVSGDSDTPSGALLTVSMKYYWD